MRILKKAGKFLKNIVPVILKGNFIFAFPKTYRFFEIKPKSATVLVTNRCNLRCMMCRQWKEKPGDELSTEDWGRVFEDLKNNGIRNMHFSGGEPLLRADLEQLILRASGLGFTVGITTNGTLLTRERLKSLMDAGLISIAVSMDATGDGYENIRGVKGAYPKMIIALDAISEARQNTGLDSYINFTLMKTNLKDLKGVKSLADKYGIPMAICLLDGRSSIFNLEENRENLWIKDTENQGVNEVLAFLKREMVRLPRSVVMTFPGLDYIRNYFKDPVQKSIPCFSSQDRVIIDPYGNFMGGCMSMGFFGNLKEVPFKKLIKDKKYSCVKTNMFYKRCPGCSCGYLFNLRMYVPSIFRDTYARIVSMFPKA